MPDTFRDHQKAAFRALAAKRGQTTINALKGPFKNMFDWMTEHELEELAESFSPNTVAHMDTDLRKSTD